MASNGPKPSSSGTDSAPGSADSTLATPWQLRLLGGCEIDTGNGAPLRLRTRAVALLLARLALRPGHDHGREEMTELLWPSAPPDVGRNRLRQALAVLRNILEPLGRLSAPVLLADRRTLRLRQGAIVSDIDELEAAMARGDAAAAQRLAAGELLPGYFDDWVLEERRQLAERLGRLSGSAVPPTAARPDSAADPGLAAGGAAQHRPARHPLPHYLTSRVGLDADLRALIAKLQARRLVVLRGPGGVGKTRLAVEAATQLQQQSAAGAGAGVGAGFDPVVFVPLAACRTPERMFEAVAMALRRDGGQAAGPPLQQLESMLGGQRALLVLDNFEQLVDGACADIAAWLDCLPELHLLITSRRALGLDGEAEQLLQALPLPGTDGPLQAHAANPAVALFVDRARLVRSDFQLGKRNHALVTAIVRELHGLPLALELAAARLRGLTLADMHAALTRHGTLGTSGAGGTGSRDGTVHAGCTDGSGETDGADSEARTDGARSSDGAKGAGVAGGNNVGALSLLTRTGPRAGHDPRHASMLRVVDWSWQLLRPVQQALLQRMAEFDGGVTLQMLQHALALDVGALGIGALAGRVDDLVASSVVYLRSGSDGRGRFHVFEPVREFTLALQDTGERTQAHHMHAQVLAAWAAGLGAAPALDAFRDEMPNVLQALHTLARGPQPATALRLLLDCDAALVDVAMPPTGLSMARQALARVELQADAALVALAAAAHALLAERSFDIGEREAAAWHAARGLALAPAGGAEQAEALCAAARIALRVDGDAAAARGLGEQGLTLARSLARPDLQARALATLSVAVVRVEHDIGADLAMKREAIALWRQAGSPARVAAATVGLAISHGFGRRYAEQLSLLDTARAAADLHGQRALYAFATSVRGYCLADLKRWHESAAMFRECLLLSWDIGAWREWFYAMWNLPRTLAHLRRPAPAARLMACADVFYAQRFGTLGWEDLRERRRTRALVRALVGAEDEAALWQEGAALTAGQAMALALEETLK